ncbi:MAG: hypothetical protein DMG42_35590 [Acidobacteria bacterium]|nr:MAG: hypothetical protein DMG42_35590 [Acidobacteriota bacterium]
MRKGLKAALGIRDAVVKDNDGSGNQVFLDKPPNIPDRGVHRIVRVGAAEDARITALPRQFDLGVATFWQREKPRKIR